MKKIYWFIILVVLSTAGAAFGLGIIRARAQAPTPSDDQVNAIARQLYCPVCENIPLDVCPTQACAQWREQIRQMLAQGKNESEIKTYFVQMYGDRVLATPPAHGLNWLVYVIPPIAILLGAFILWRALQAWRSPSSPAKPVEPAPAEDDEYVRRLEDELRKRRE